MRTILLAITAALAVFTAMQYFSTEQVSSSRLLVKSPIESAWKLWKEHYGRDYGTETEEKFRFGVFTENYKKIAAWNSQPQTSSMALNFSADLTKPEFKAQYTGFNRSKFNFGSAPTQVFSEAGVPDSYDARDDNLVNAVKNQGQCGSCWAFSTVGAIESQLAKSGPGLGSFSEQMLVDCAPSPNQGCNGGDMEVALAWVVENPLASESDYPYKGRDGNCQSKSSHPGKISDWGKVRSNAAQIRASIYNKGAVSVAVEADQDSFQFYSGGVITSGCGTELDHGVTGIGYGSDDGTDYFLIRNSWGADWGVEGYVKIAPNQCGVMQEVSYAVA